VRSSCQYQLPCFVFCWHVCCLQLSPATLLQLAEMGYSEREAQRALRFSGSDLAAAVDFLTEQRQQEQVIYEVLCSSCTSDNLHYMEHSVACRC
jgi:hypothetical protein